MLRCSLAGTPSTINFAVQSTNGFEELLCGCISTHEVLGFEIVPNLALICKNELALVVGAFDKLGS
jgi:hypothetical protein